MPTGFRMKKTETAAFGRSNRAGNMRGRWRGTGTAEMDSDGDGYRKVRNKKRGDAVPKKRRRNDDEPEASRNDTKFQPHQRNSGDRSEGRDRPFVGRDGGTRAVKPGYGRERRFVDGDSGSDKRGYRDGGGVKPGYGRERRFVDGDSGYDKRGYRDGGGEGGRRWQKDDEYGGGRDYRRNEGRDFGGPVARRKEPNIPKWKLGKVGKGDFETDTRGNGDGRVERHHRVRRGEDRGRQDSYRKGDFETDRRGNGDGHVERRDRGRRGEDRGRQDSYRNEGRDSRDEKPGLKGRRRDEIMSSDKRKGEAESDKYLKGKDKVDESGREVDGGKKSSGDVNAETDAAPRKRKRIKTDRYDLSNKRFEDVVPSDEKTEKDTDEEIQVSKNAQFRAITPSPAILSFVENNLLGRRRLHELQKAGYNIKISTPLDNTPTPADSVASSTSTERDRIEEPVFRNKLEFFAAAKVQTSFPPPVIPEIAFAGRSNVGKSSLLNALTRQWGVARTSDKPGLTQTINFFRLASKICLVDLPGYGFAYAKEEVKDSWEELVKEYVSTRVGLQRVCLLVDTKWGMKPRDTELIDLMETHETPYQIVLTKTDIVFPIDVARRAMQIQEKLKANRSIVNPVMMVSSQSGAGIRSLRSVLAKLTRFAK